ncbi:MAG TPA: IS110 family transposase [Victivallales bacterium]|nr:IS110 family transposase [Victivallales bacterium]
MPNKVKSAPPKVKNSYRETLKMLNSHSAGIDVGSIEMWVCVPKKDASKENIKQFGSFTPDLIKLCNWLSECKIESVAMESTGIYWIPLFQMLEGRGFDVVLVNAHELKNVSGRPKTDRFDCQWIQRLHSYGLLKASFRPEDSICRLRVLMRHRKNLVEESCKHIQHMQKSLRLMNVVLEKVISDITGEVGMKIINAILRGEHDPYVLAKYRNERIKSSESTIAKALTGNYRKEEIFILQQAVDSYNHVNKQIKKCDNETEKLIAKIGKNYKNKFHKSSTCINTVEPKKFKNRRKGAFKGSSSKVSGYLQSVIGTEITDINGIDMLGALTLISETGFNMNKWATEKHFCSWLSLSPNRKITGGKLLSSRTKRVNNRAKQIFKTAAVTLRNSNCYLGAFYRRMRKKAGPGVAVTATARKIAIIYYHTLKHGRSFVELGADYYEKTYRDRIKINLEKRAGQLGLKLVELKQAL